jgi:hypothetical protein
LSWSRPSGCLFHQPEIGKIDAAPEYGGDVDHGTTLFFTPDAIAQRFFLFC